MRYCPCPSPEAEAPGTGALRIAQVLNFFNKSLTPKTKMLIFATNKPLSCEESAQTNHFPCGRFPFRPAPSGERGPHRPSSRQAGNILRHPPTNTSYIFIVHYVLSGKVPPSHTADIPAGLRRTPPQKTRSDLPAPTVQVREASAGLPLCSPVNDKPEKHFGKLFSPPYFIKLLKTII